jgi:hypothetical protein
LIEVLRNRPRHLALGGGVGHRAFVAPVGKIQKARLRDAALPPDDAWERKPASRRMSTAPAK